MLIQLNIITEHSIICVAVIYRTCRIIMLTKLLVDCIRVLGKTYSVLKCVVLGQRKQKLQRFCTDTAALPLILGTLHFAYVSFPFSRF